MCKSDILKAFGYHVNVNSRRRAQFSAQIDDEETGGVSTPAQLFNGPGTTMSRATSVFGSSVIQNSRRGCRYSQEDEIGTQIDGNSTVSETNPFPFPIINEIHNPFGFSPSISPQLVQVFLKF